MKETILWVLIACATVHAHKSCCPDNQTFSAESGCNYTKEINLECTLGFMVLQDITLEGDKVSTKDAPTFTFVEDPNKYCVGQMYRNGSTTQELIPIAVTCYDNPSGGGLQVSGILTLTSVVFLLITIAVYSYLPQLRDLQGMCYMCLCVSMAIGFLSLGILQLTPGFHGSMCTATGFLIYFWMLATFFWMNVICINMYRTIADSRFLKKTERKQYMLYSCYAWGATIVMFIVAMVTNFTEGNHYKPKIGLNACWINGYKETWVFFYGPVALLIVSNLVLFFLSSYTLWKDTKKYEVSKLQNLRHRFLLSLKLFLVMGISWTFEIASFAHGQSHIIWTIADTFNCLQGLVIFILLVVLRKRAIRGLAKDGFCLFATGPLANKLSPHDESGEEQILDEVHTEVRLD